MLLVVDVGNTHTRLVLLGPEEALGRVRFPTDPRRDAAATRAELAALLEPHGGVEALRGACVASVVPGAEPALHAALEGTSVHFVTHASRLGFRLEVERPEQVGPDRLVNAAGALELAEPPLVVVDVGTAVTVCGLGPGPAFLGGAIAPGLGISAQALFERGARLPEVSLEAPEGVLGRTTEEALRAGLVLGHAGLVDGLVRRAVAALGGAARVLATGGGLGPLRPWLEQEVEEVPDLTERGLRAVARAEGLGAA